MMNQPFDPSKINVGLADASNQALQNSQLLSEDQFKQLMQVYDPKTNLATQAYANNLQPDAPKLQFGVQQGDFGSMLGQGLSGGVNNYYAMKQRGQQQQAYQNMLQSYQQNHQRQMDILQAQNQADQERRNRGAGVLPGGTRDIYSVLTPKQQDEMLKGAGDKQLGVVYKPIEGTAEGQAQVNKGKAINDALSTMPPVEVNGVPIPAQVDARHNIQGFAPTTTVDVNQGVLANQQTAANVQKAKNELSVQPTQLQQDVQLKSLEIAQKQLEAQFAEQEKQLQIRLEQIREKQGTADYNKTIQEQKMFQQGRQLFQQLKDSGALNSTDPAKQAQMQAQLGMYGFKYNPPESSMQTIKKKDGTIYMLDKNTGKIGKLESDGTVKQWQDFSQ